MLGLKPQISGVGSNRLTNLATATAHLIKLFVASN